MASYSHVLSDIFKRSLNIYNVAIFLIFFMQVKARLNARQKRNDLYVCCYKWNKKNVFILLFSECCVIYCCFAVYSYSNLIPKIYFYCCFSVLVYMFSDYWANFVNFKCSAAMKLDNDFFIIKKKYLVDYPIHHMHNLL